MPVSGLRVCSRLHSYPRLTTTTLAKTMRFPYRVLLCLLAVLVALPASYFLLRSIALNKARRAQARAEPLLSQALQLEVGRATKSQVQQLIKQFGPAYYEPPHQYPMGLASSPPPAHPSPNVKINMVDACIYGETFAFVFDNSAMHRLGLAPLVRLGVGLSLYQGILCGRAVSFSSGTGMGAVGIDIHEYWPAPNDTSWFQAKIGRLQTYVDLSAPVPEDIRRGLYSFNFDCLSVVGGCRRSQDLVPWIWAQRGRKGVYFPN